MRRGIFFTFSTKVKPAARNIYTALGPALALLIWLLTDLQPGNKQVTYMAGVAVWMCTWWFTEAVSFGITAMVPVLVLPMLGVANVKEVAQQYSDSIIFLFIGGFMLAFAIEKWGFHKRIALKILSVVGRSPSTVLFGVMLSTFLISNWISNTATTMMLFAAVLALVAEMRVHMPKGHERFAAALLLGLAFSATIGGMATPVGTPPNMYFFKQFRQTYPGDETLNFFKWTLIGYPISITLLLGTFGVLNFYFLRKSFVHIDRAHFRRGYAHLGPMCQEERWVFGLFIACILLWLTRADIDFGSWQFRGWSRLFPVPGYTDDSLVAVAAAVILFVVPSRRNPGEGLLIWEDAKKLRYDIILMFGSGFALAYGFEVSGLSSWLASLLGIMKGIHPLLIIVGICVVVTIISEFASNIASIQLAIPVMVALQKELDLPPLLLMIPATFAASLGFMLPVATAANTIVFGTRQIEIRDMVRVGLLLDIIGISVIALFCYIYLR